MSDKRSLESIARRLSEIAVSLSVNRQKVNAQKIMWCLDDMQKVIDAMPDEEQAFHEYMQDQAAIMNTAMIIDVSG